MNNLFAISYPFMRLLRALSAGRQTRSDKIYDEISSLQPTPKQTPKKTNPHSNK